MAESLALTDHEKLLSGPSAPGRRAPGDTYAIVENVYQKTAIASGAAAATTARSNRLAQLNQRPDGR